MSPAPIKHRHVAVEGAGLSRFLCRLSIKENGNSPKAASGFRAARMRASPDVR